MPTKEDADMVELITPGYDYPYGSNADGASTEQDAINLHNQNEQLAYDYDIQLQMHEASPEEFPEPKALP